MGVAVGLGVGVGRGVGVGVETAARSGVGAAKESARAVASATVAAPRLPPREELSCSEQATKNTIIAAKTTRLEYRPPILIYLIRRSAHALQASARSRTGVVKHIRPGMQPDSCRAKQREAALPRAGPIVRGGIPLIPR